VGAAPEGDIGGFTRASPGWVWQFPRDHGPHNDFQTEWWYYTGNLQTADGRRFGFQLTFFRRALLPPVQLAERASDWGGGQVYMAHFAISDIGGGQFFASERLSRGAAGLAGAQGQPYQVWLEDWQVQEAPGQGACKATLPPPCMVYLKAANGPVALALRLLDAKGPVLQGDQGFSRKGAGDGQASYYYSLTRLQANGTVTVNGQEFSVTGSAWMDHEFSTSALQKDQVGWDWFSIQLEDGREMMVFQIRRADGTIDPFSSGAVIEADGRITPLQRQDFSLEVTDTWQSRASGAEYPSGWRLRVAKAGLDLTLSPLMKNQELNVSYAYWEGAVLVGGSVAGVGYVELTGYSGSMGGEF
jgi:predicted secreted hydrolase